MKTKLFIAAVSWLLVAAAAQAQNQTADTKVLTLEGAKTVIAGAFEEARRVKAPGGAIAVVDEGGHVLAVERWDNTFPAAAQISTARRALPRCSASRPKRSKTPSTKAALR